MINQRRKTVLLILFSIIAALALVEFLLRFTAPIHLQFPEEAYEYDPELGFRLKKNQHLLKTTDFQQEILTNRFGTANFQTDFRGYAKLVFALGDSHTQGTGVPADMSYPFLLDMNLNRDTAGVYSPKYGIANLGTSGFGLKQSIIALQQFKESLGKPAFVLFLGCDNDYLDDLVFESGLRHRHLVSGNPRWEPFTDLLRFAAYDTQIGLRIRLIATNRAKEDVYANAAHNSAESSVAVKEKKQLDQLALFCKNADCKLIVSWVEEGKSYEWLKLWALENAAGFADWQPQFHSLRNSIPEIPSENQHSGNHFRGWVNRVIADEFAVQIRKLE